MINETVTDSRLYAIVLLYDMQTDFFGKALDGISDQDSHKRLDTKANHIAWLAGSLVEQRYEIAKELGLKEQQSAHELFAHNKGIQDGITYPNLSAYLKDWQHISPILRKALMQANEAQLAKPFEMGDGQSFPLFDMITFSIYREANCIGQIALWRRLLGYEAMKYM